LRGTANQAHSVRRIGKGRLFVGGTADEALAALGVARDFEYTRPAPDANLMFVHRKLDDGDLYFVDNRNDRAEDVNATFRVDGKAPELWDAASRQTQPASYSIADGRTTVPIHLEPYGTTFVMFRKPAETAARTLPEEKETVVAGGDDSLNKDWAVSFEPSRGAPETAQFDRLISWSESADPGVKYFSGSATYTKTIQVPASAFSPAAHLWLDLGDVENIAEVAVNGKYQGIEWKTPFRVDVTQALVPGRNQIVVQVTNLWVNRLIGDQQPWALKKYAFADFTPYKADSPLLPSGLLGPVRLVSASAP
jgi:hypothetical protein